MENFIGSIFRKAKPCSECGKTHNGNYLLELWSDGRSRITCDKCRRLHWEADILMGVIQAVPDVENPFSTG